MTGRAPAATDGMRRGQGSRAPRAASIGPSRRRRTVSVAHLGGPRHHGQSCGARRRVHEHTPHGALAPISTQPHAAAPDTHVMPAGPSPLRPRCRHPHPPAAASCPPLRGLTHPPRSWCQRRARRAAARRTSDLGRCRCGQCPCPRASGTWPPSRTAPSRPAARTPTGCGPCRRCAGRR